MTAPYNKRMKGCWRQGKGCKGDSEERQYSKTEIKQQLAEDEEDYLHRYHKGARKKNFRQRLEYRVKWYEEILARYKNSPSIMDTWFRRDLEKAKKELEELNAKEVKK